MNNFYIFVAVATIAQYILSALWYSAFFGKQWMVINGFDQLSKPEKEASGKSMGPFYGLQLLITTVANIVFGTVYLAIKTNMELTAFSSLVLLGFILPALVEGVIWGNTKKQVWGTQLSIMILNRVANILIATVAAYFFLR